MASLTIARPGKVSERQYLGDLAGLFARQRRRAGVALTPDSFAADLAANDALRSGLFTLCTAISRMGESDLSPEELLGLVARALGDAGSAEGEAGTPVPEAMREAFLSGYGAWRERDTHPVTDFNDPEDWPLASARKPPMREDAQDAVAGIAVNGPSAGPANPIARRTVQEALSRVHRDRDTTPARSGEDLGSITLGELKEFLDEIEHRVSRLGPHIHQLSASVARETARRDGLPPGAILPFPVPAVERRKEDRRKSNRQRDSEQHLNAEDLMLADVDARPRGIDALLAAAQAWAKATPPARPASASGSLTLNSAWTGTATASGDLAQPIASEDAAQLSASAAALPQDFENTTAKPLPSATAVEPEPREGSMLSRVERLQTAIFRLPPRNVFLALVGLTLLAGCFAGYLAYHTLHPARVQFKNMELTVDFGASRASTSPTPQPAQTTNPAIQAAVTQTSIQNQGPSTVPAHKPSPAIPFAVATDKPAVRPAAIPTPLANTASGLGASQPSLYVPAPTMIAYARSSPQPVAPGGRAGTISGTVPVEITISRLGDITAARTLGGPPELGPAAVAAARAWRFRPYLVDGKATAVTTTLQFYFKGADVSAPATSN